VPAFPAGPLSMKLYLDPHRAPPLRKLFGASFSASLLVMKLQLDPHRAPPLRKLLRASFSAGLLLTLRCRHSGRICSR
jgi:hypothetical protein